MDALGLLTTEDPVKPEFAVIGWRANDRVIGTLHEMVPDPKTGREMIGPGGLFTAANMQALAITLGTAGTRQILPENVLVSEQGIVAWWTPAHHRPVFFDTKTADLDDLNGRTALHPPLLLIGKPRALSIFALGANRRPRGNDPVFRAPVFNVYGHGGLCAGTARLPGEATATNIPGYEEAFFDSSAVHTSLGEKHLTSHPGGHTGLWRELADTPHKEFPYRYLVIIGAGIATVQDALNQKVGDDA